MTTAVLTREEAEQSPQEKKPRSKLPLGTEELKKLDAYWRAANYLSVGQIYLRVIGNRFSTSSTFT